MKRKILSLILCLALTLTLLPAPAFALGSFADVTDEATARNVEVLRLMGVLEGDANGGFRPNGSLTRAEFCKMTIVLQGRADQVTRNRSRTIFPDVRASHWAAGYVNLAATPETKDGAALMHGFPDGTFLPDKTISCGEAVTVLLRALGYSDADSGGIWPDGYIALARESGLGKGLSLSGGATITRAQAAKLFVNLLTAEDGAGKTMLDKLSYTVDLTAEPVTLYSVDMVNGKLRLSDKSDPKMAKPMDSTVLSGLKGHVVTNAEKKAVTFLPVTSNNGGVLTDAAVIVSANGSAAGFDALTGGARNYTIYRNGVRATSAELKKNDVAIYNADNNTVQVTDTRLTVYYENCAPSQAAPATIEVLGGTKLDVMTTAQQSLSKFKPGQTMVILLTADGRVAGAVENGSAQGNALAYVGDKVQLICGSTLKELTLTGVDTSAVTGQVVRVSQNGKSDSQIYLSRQNVTADAVDLTTMKMGNRTVAADALVIEDGKVTTLAALGVSRVEKSEIAYYRTNSANEVALLVIGNAAGNVYYGRAIAAPVYDEDDPTIVVAYKIGIDGNGHNLEPIQTGNYVRTGDFVEAKINEKKTMFTSLTTLTKLASVPASAWIGDTAVNYGGQTYTVNPKTVICYNRNSGTWFAATETETALALAKAYGGTMDLYVKDGVVRIVEVRS